MLNRHARIAEKTRKALLRSGLSLYAEDGYSNTVTVFCIPYGTTASDILKKMQQKHSIMLAGSFDVLAGEVIRIGHMGFNCTEENMLETFTALNDVLNELNVPLKEPLIWK